MRLNRPVTGMKCNENRTRSDIDFHTYGRPDSDAASPAPLGGGDRGHRRSLEPESRIKDYLKAPSSERSDPSRHIPAKITQRDR